MTPLHIFDCRVSADVRDQRLFICGLGQPSVIPFDLDVVERRMAGDAKLSKVAPALKEKHPEYRIESEAKPDLKWELYLSWGKTVPYR